MNPMGLQTISFDHLNLIGIQCLRIYLNSYHHIATSYQNVNICDKQRVTLPDWEGHLDHCNYASRMIVPSNLSI